MRSLITIGAVLLFISCRDTVKTDSDHQDWTEKQKRRLYTDSFAFTGRDFPDRRNSTTSFKDFMDKHYPNVNAYYKYDPLIYALEENYVDTTKIDSSLQWFRLTVTPSFSKPYCLILSKENDKCLLVAKITNGYGSYFAGTLAVNLKYELRDTVYDNTLRSIQAVGFWNLPITDTLCQGGFDGETWSFELIENGRYRFLSRWHPESCGDSLTRKLAQIGLRIRDLSRLEKVLEVIAVEKKDMFRP